MPALSSWQAALAAEHAALWCYGVLAAQATSATAEPEMAGLAPALGEAFAVHRRRRDELEAQIRAAAATPEPAAAGYELPALETAAELRAAARDIERACATGYADLVAHTTDDQRRWAIDALSDAATRQLAFAGPAEHFPGLDEFAAGSDEG